MSSNPEHCLSSQSDVLNGYAEFAVPTIADGKVFASGGTGVSVYAEPASDAPFVAAVTNAASYAADAISPGSLICLFGSGLAAVTANASQVPLPLSVADTSVTINGLVAPLLYESPGQVNAQVPWETSAGAATVVVRTRGAVSPPVTINVQPAAPGLFTDGAGHAAALNADGSANSAQHPARAGSFVSVFFTGQGPVAASLEDGDAPSVGQTISASLNVSATIGNLPVQIKFAGLAPLYPGVAQINLTVPALASGVYPVTITVGGKISNTAQLAISGT